MPGLRIAGREVGPNHPTYIIAEIGSNHDGSLQKAQELIHAAAEAGADAVKFQSLRYDKVHLPSRHDQAFADFFAQIELPETWYPDLAAAAARAEVHWLSSVTYLEAVDLLVDSGAPAIKIASAQFDLYPEVVAHAARTGLPLIMSTGLADVAGIHRMLQVVAEEGNDQVALLHCVSEYPADPASLNLRIMASYRQLFGCVVGFSDHSLGIEVPTAATALGAAVIEKHLTLDRAGAGPDHHFATEPDEFSSMVDAIRVAECARGDGLSRPMTPAAADLRQSMKYKWVVAEAVRAGEPLSRDSMVLRRLPDGIERDMIDVIERAVASRELSPGEHLSWPDLRFDQG